MIVSRLTLGCLETACLNAEVSKITYVFVFMGLAILFVPVIFFFGFDTLVSPCCYMVSRILVHSGEISRRIFSHQSDFIGLIFAFTYLTIYNFIFLLAAFYTFRVSTLIASKVHQKLIQILFLFLVFLCSFAKVIHITGGFSYGSGTYNFWTACIRYPESPRK